MRGANDRAARTSMMQRRRTSSRPALVALVLAVLTLGAACSDGSSSTAGALPANELVPVGVGSATTLDSLAGDGQPAVINVWASFCTPCITEMPDFEAVHQRLGDQVAIVGVTDDDDEQATLELAERTGVTYPLYRDPSRRLGVALEVTGLPSTVFVGPDGQVVERHQGALDEAELSQMIEDLWGIT